MSIVALLHKFVPWPVPKFV